LWHMLAQIGSGPDGDLLAPFQITVRSSNVGPFESKWTIGRHGLHLADALATERRARKRSIRNGAHSNMNKDTRSVLVATTIVAVTACSSEPVGDPTVSTEQPLNAGEFVLLNEVELNPPGAGNAPWQYIELEGTPGALLGGIQLVVVDG